MDFVDFGDGVLGFGLDFTLDRVHVHIEFCFILF